MSDGAEYSETDWKDMPEFEVNLATGAQTQEKKHHRKTGWIGFTDHFLDGVFWYRSRQLRSSLCCEI